MLIILSAVFYGHLAAYYFIVAAFGITSTTLLHALGFATVLLPISFISSLILSEWFLDNIFTRTFYRFSCLWLCYFHYLFLGAILYSILAFFISNPAMLMLEGKIIFMMAILASSYGIVHANDMKTKIITVALPHLPNSWKERKAVFISDVHLGQIRGAKFAEKIVRKISRINPDILLIGGDMYDGAKGDPFALVASFKQLEPKLGKYFVMGNHEEFEDNSHFKRALEVQGIRVLTDEMIEIEGLQLIGADYQTTVSEQAFKAMLDSISLNAHMPSIILKHVPSNLEIAEAKGISMSLSGHTHRAQAWPLNIFTFLQFKGYDYGLKKLGKMNVYTSSGIGTWGPPIRVGSDSELIVINFTSA